MYFREINKRCTICLVLWHYLGLKNSRNTVRHWDDFERKIREIPLASVARKKITASTRHNYADQHSSRFASVNFEIIFYMLTPCFIRKLILEVHFPLPSLLVIRIYN